MSQRRQRVLLAWEAGAGRGHLLALRAVALALGPDFVFDAALCRMDHADILQPLCDLVFPCAFLSQHMDRRQAAGSPVAATWGEFLGDLGFADPDILTRQVVWWMEAIVARRPSMVVGEFAPCALLAAKALGIPAVSVGVGYSTPPPGLAEFPILLAEHSTRIYAEDELLQTLNQVAGLVRLPAFERFTDLYQVSAQLPRTIAELDAYAAHRAGPYMPPIDEPMPDLADCGHGDEVLMYFSTDERDDEVLLRAIESLPMPRRLYMPGISDALAQRLSASGIIIQRTPMPYAEIAQRSRLLLHSGNHGMIALALAMGLTQVSIPRHTEHLYHARAAEKLGTSTVLSRHIRDVDHLRSAFIHAYDDEPSATLARSIAPTLRHRLIGDPTQMVRDRLLPLLSSTRPSAERSAPRAG